MQNTPWLEQYQQALCQRKLPSDYVNRLVSELADHGDDIAEETGTSTDACNRLGEPDQLADAALHEFRQRSVLNRRPVLAFCTFFLLPLPSLLVLWFLSLTVWFIAGESLDSLGLDTIAGIRRDSATPLQVGLLLTALHLICLFCILAPPAILVCFYARLARRTFHRTLWTVVPCLILALLTALATHSITHSDEPGKSTLMLGAAIGKFEIRQVLQFMIPLSVGLLMMRRREHAAIPVSE